MVEIGDTIGRYTLQGHLGAGGMGQVYRALDPQLQRAVAIKVLLPEDGDARAEWTARMVREARAAAAFSHPNAVAVYDVGEHEGRPFIVMELVVGRSLRSYLDDEGVPIPRRLRWLAEIARALGAAHRAGLVHRDVKPDNVMVREDGTIKILDFGIARRTAGAVDPSAPTAAPGIETLTKTGALVGTPVYMAPEQLRQGLLDGRTDQFAWGVVGFELLTGRRPWRAPDLLSLVVAMTEEAPPELRELRPDVPAPAAATIQRALAKRPEDRFATMEDAAAALEAPVSAARVVEVVAPKRPPRPGGRGAAAIAVVALAGGATWAIPRLRAPDGAAAAAPVASVSAPVVSASLAVPRASALPVSASAPPPSEPPPRHPCAGAPADGSCAAPLEAWCDVAEKPMACCARGLVATGEDGLCGCPPGGSTEGPDAPSACPKSKSGPTSEQIQAIVRPAFPAFRECYQAALEKARGVKGRVAVTFDLTPEGRVFKARVGSASLPAPEAQACILKVFRALTFPAPSDGHRTVSYPILLEPGE